MKRRMTFEDRHDLNKEIRYIRSSIAESCHEGSELKGLK
jgi:hypothetical protein